MLTENNSTSMPSSGTIDDNYVYLPEMMNACVKTD